MTFSPSNKGFGKQFINTTSQPVIFTLRNIGGGTATGSVTLTGANADQFEITSGGESFSLSQNQSKDIYVRFVPRSEGFKTAALLANGDSPCNDVSVTLSGTGTSLKVMPWIPLLLLNENNELPQPNSCGEGLPLTLSVLSFPETVTAGSSYDGSVIFRGGFEDIANPRIFLYIPYSGGGFDIIRSTSAPIVSNCSMNFSIRIPDGVTGTGNIFFKLIDYHDSVDNLWNWSNNAVSNEVSQTITVE